MSFLNEMIEPNKPQDLKDREKSNCIHASWCVSWYE